MCSIHIIQQCVKSVTKNKDVKQINVKISFLSFFTIILSSWQKNLKSLFIFTYITIVLSKISNKHFTYFRCSVTFKSIF